MRLYKKVSKSRETFKVRDFVNTSKEQHNFFLKFPPFYPVNDEIQSLKIQKIKKPGNFKKYIYTNTMSISKYIVLYPIFIYTLAVTWHSPTFWFKMLLSWKKSWYWREDKRKRDMQSQFAIDTYKTIYWLYNYMSFVS